MLNGHKHRVNDLQFSSDGSTILSCSFDNTIRLWDVNSGKELKKINSNDMQIVFPNIQFSSDEASAWDGTIRQGHIKSGQEISCIQTNCNFVNGTQFLRDCQFLMSFLRSGKMEIWSVKSGKKIERIRRTLKSDLTSRNFLQMANAFSSCSMDKKQFEYRI
ncbi:WD-repeat protein [Reticulomyxa filosa]|uniref:WD-repeat protein n=1 Tax=Reticulomyxa filosa TaxID=46433 RepID=X6LS09_RETFI|nr:WD-repeat protein [Reticulomyxa filosa]|eukprot:ETO04399.1 WD-repeat protein [Reticulomyxa filosa]